MAYFLTEDDDPNDEKFKDAVLCRVQLQVAGRTFTTSPAKWAVLDQQDMLQALPHPWVVHSDTNSLGKGRFTVLTTNGPVSLDADHIAARWFIRDVSDSEADEPEDTASRWEDDPFNYDTV